MKQPEIPGADGQNALRLVIYWTVVGIPLAWGIYNTVLKLHALFA